MTIGDKNFPEENILGALYAQALQAKGYKVTLKDNVGSSEIIYKALTSGQIDMYPEYTGVLLSAVAEQTKRRRAPTAPTKQAKAFAETQGRDAARLHAVLRLRRAGHAAGVRERTQPLERSPTSSRWARR